MRILYVSGSPREQSNTDYLLQRLLSATGGDFMKLSNYRIEHCKSCWACLQGSTCSIKDDMTEIIMPKLLKSDAIVLGTPVFFNNVSATLKAFIDRTWCSRGKLKNKIGGSVVVGRKYGAESAITAINAFFLKHEMIVANRGVCGIAFHKEDIVHDVEAIKATQKLAERIKELLP